MSINFILNNTTISSNLPPGSLLLDFIRYNRHLTGTKIGCREGDCGACTVLVGEMQDKKVRYRSATSCLMALGNADGKHIVTVEGLNMAELNPIQQAVADEGGTQCGFCTPGFVVSFAGFCLSGNEPSQKNVVEAINGNICRCTGYKSLERAAAVIAKVMQEKDAGAECLEYVTSRKILPEYFATIPKRLKALSVEIGSGLVEERSTSRKFLAGGTDLYVQQHDNMQVSDINFLANRDHLLGISQQGNTCTIGASVTVTDIVENSIIRNHFPEIARYIKLVSSTPIRNMATLAGNFVNASPIGDLTIFFLALDARLILAGGSSPRELPLRKLYKGYKMLDIQPGEYIRHIWFDLPGKNTRFNFEKVSKRTHLDIASVNTALSITTEGKKIKSASLSAGGVGPVPMFLVQTSAFLTDNILEEETICSAVDIIQSEISPISDARGTEQYKRLLMSQLFKAHFVSLFPFLKAEKILSP